MRPSRFAGVVQGGLLAWFLLFPSLALLQKYFGGQIAVEIAAAGTIALVVLSLASQALVARLATSSRRSGPILIAAVMAALLIGFAVLYPQANSGHASWLSPSGIVGGGSDRDEALNLGVKALFAGHNPYSVRTQLDNPVSQLPGSLLLAAPFAFLGNAAWQNILWLGVWLLVLGSLLEDWRLAAAVSVIVFVFSPAVLQDFVTGGDLATNSIVVLIACLALKRTRPKGTATQTSSGGQAARVAAVIFAGVAFATRLNFVLLLPLIFVSAIRDAGWRTAILEVTGIGLTLLAVSLPFYFLDPGAFAPLAKQDKFRLIPAHIPHGGLILPALCGVFSCVVAFVVKHTPQSDWLLAAGVVLTAPATLLILVAAVTHSTSLQPTVYGLPGLFFGVPAIWARAARSSISSLP